MAKTKPARVQAQVRRLGQIRFILNVFPNALVTLIGKSNRMCTIRFYKFCTSPIIVAQFLLPLSCAIPHCHASNPVYFRPINNKWYPIHVSFFTQHSHTAKLKEVLKEKDRILGEATKKAAQTAKDFKSAQSGVDSSQDALKKAKTRAEKAEKAYQNWAKKVQEQKKKEAQELKKQQEKYAAELKKQEQKVKELQKSTEQLKKAKEQETKELANKKKALENELKNLEKLKSVKK